MVTLDSSFYHLSGVITRGWPLKPHALGYAVMGLTWTVQAGQCHTSVTGRGQPGFGQSQDRLGL